MDLELVRRKLAESLATLAAAEGLQVSPYMLGNATPPTIEIAGPERIEYDQALQRGSDSMMFLIRAFVGMTSDQGAQMKLDRLLNSSGPTSLKEAVETDTKLGGACDDLRVTEATGYQVYPRQTGDVLGTEWVVQIETSE